MNDVFRLAGRKDNMYFFINELSADGLEVSACTIHLDFYDCVPIHHKLLVESTHHAKAELLSSFSPFNSLPIFLFEQPISTIPSAPRFHLLSKWFLHITRKNELAIRLLHL